MGIPGYRWVRALVPEATYDAASKAKSAANNTWDEAMTTALGLYAERSPPSPIPASSLMVQEPPAAWAPAVPDVGSSRPQGPSADPAARMKSAVCSSADEILRELGHADYQHGITLRAGAALVGEASLVAAVSAASPVPQ